MLTRAACGLILIPSVSNHLMAVARGQLQLPLPTMDNYSALAAIEQEAFPFEYLSAAARVESWRKEVK